MKGATLSNINYCQLQTIKFWVFSVQNSVPWVYLYIHLLYSSKNCDTGFLDALFISIPQDVIQTIVTYEGLSILLNQLRSHLTG